MAANAPNVRPFVHNRRQMNEQDVPSLSLSAAVELRRIYCKRVGETMPTPETRELLDGGFIKGHLVAEPTRIVVEAVTARGVAALETREAQ